MSIVTETVRAFSLSKVPGKLSQYEELVQAAAPLFELSGQGLEETCKTHAQNLMFYDLMLQECKTIEDVIRMKLEEVESDLYKKHQTGPRAMSATDLKSYIKGDPQYVSGLEILLEVVHVKRQLEAVVEALKSMGWSLNNITKIRVAALDHITL